jgi:hypothetical protein
MNLGISQGSKRLDQLKIIVFFLRKPVCGRAVVSSESLPDNCEHVNTSRKIRGAFCCRSQQSAVTFCICSWQRKSTSGEIFGFTYLFAQLLNVV